MDKRNLWRDWASGCDGLALRKTNPRKFLEVVDLLGDRLESLGSFANFGVFRERAGVERCAGWGVGAEVVGASVSVIPG